MAVLVDFVVGAVEFVDPGGGSAEVEAPGRARRRGLGSAPRLGALRTEGGKFEMSLSEGIFGIFIKSGGRNVQWSSLVRSTDVRSIFYWSQSESALLSDIPRCKVSPLVRSTFFGRNADLTGGLQSTV